MRGTLALALAAVICWGLWAFFNKLAVEKIGVQAALWNAVIILIGITLYLAFTHQLFPIKQDTTGIMFAVFAGIATTAASIIFYILLSKNPAGFVVTITSLFPVVTLILSMIFLKETLTIQKIIGFILAFGAIFLLNM